MPLLRLSSISKRFGSTVALDDVTLEIGAGEIVAVVGENGAGKTTLMNIAAGSLDPDSGDTSGTAIAEKSVRMVHQHFNVIDAFTIAENLLLFDPDGPRLHTAKRRTELAAAAAAVSGIRLPHPRRRVAGLSVGEKARLEVARALAGNPSLLILDEPTSVLTREESDDLHRVIREQRARNRSIVLITHKVEEVFRVATRIVVLRRGTIVLDEPAERCTPDGVALAMVGSPTRPLAREHPTPGSRALALVDVSTRPEDGETALAGINLELRRREITALLGVSGNGQRALARLLRGIGAPSAGTIELHGKPVSRAALARARGIAHIPENRTADGFIADMSIEDNLRVALGVDTATARRIGESIIERFEVRASSVRQTAGSLSGGNQQKIIAGRELARNPDILVAAEPTRGLDFGVSRTVREAIMEAAGNGCAVLLITSDVDEAFEMATKFHTIYRGQVSQPMTREDVGPAIARSFAGLS